MKKLIRHGVFETNSSSCHSISIADSTKQFAMDAIYPEKDGSVRLTGGEYGREFYRTNEALEKANYAAQALGECDTLIDLIKEQTGAYDVIIDNTNGYIDHESVGLVQNDKEWLKNFIFNKNSWLFLAHDEGTPDPTFYVVSEFKDGIEIAPHFKYKLVVGESGLSTKFLNKPTEENINDALEYLFEDMVIDEFDYFSKTRYSNRTSEVYEYSPYHKQPYINEDCSGGEVFFVKDVRHIVREKIDSDPKNKDISSFDKSMLCRELTLNLYEDIEYCKSFEFKIIQLG